MVHPRGRQTDKVEEKCFLGTRTKDLFAAAHGDNRHGLELGFLPTADGGLNAAMDYDRNVEAMDTQDDNEIDPPSVKNPPVVVGNDPANGGGGGTTGPEQMSMDDQDNLDDEVRSEATFSFKVENLSRFNDSILSFLRCFASWP